MKNKRLSVLIGSICLILVLAVLPFMAACPATPAPKIIKIGGTGSFSTRQGIQMTKVLSMLADQLNEAGGLVVKGEKYNVEMITYDDKYQADVGRAAYEKLIFEDKVDFLTGMAGSAPMLATVDLTEANKIPWYHIGAAPAFLDPKYKYLIHCYSIGAGNATVAIFHSKQEFDPTNAWKTVVVVETDDPTGHAFAPYSEKAWPMGGVEVAATLYVPMGATDLTPVATKIKSLDPDVVFLDCVVASEDVFRIVKAVWESGWKGVMYSHYAQTVVPDLVNSLGKETVEGLLLTVTDPSLFPEASPMLKEFREAYEKRYGVWETDYLEFCGGWYCLMESIKRADSLDPDDLMAVREGLEYDFPFGHAKLLPRPDVNNPNYIDCAYPRYIGEVVDGKIILKATISADELIEAAERYLGTSLLP
jgi:branched-chain amino acid transport system substrate-binding protein